MKFFLPHHIAGQQFWVTADRTIFWEEKKALILSDLHLGKSGHFRKNGIGIPQNMFQEDMQRLLHNIQHFKAEQLIVVGDLFHSHNNKEHDLFIRWRKDIAHVDIHLIMGNHDVLGDDWYSHAEIQLHKDMMLKDGFVFTHDMANNEIRDGHYYFSGHIHPGVMMRGVGKQVLRFPCFHFSPTQAVLPAFGRFTGIHPITTKKEDAVFVLADNNVFQLQ
jgi:DNA ligase-associated metallophosphoesterase